MITEDYVSFENAKLLKEKGFDAYGDGSYDSGIEIYKEYSPVGKLNSCATSKPNKKAYPAPTLQMAMKWLREIYDLHIIAYPWKADEEEKASHWCCQVYKSFNRLGNKKYTDETPKSYEEACEAAIKYCLENLF